MAVWLPCRGPRQPAVNEPGGGPVRHVRLTEIERLAGPSAPSSATPHTELDLTPRTSQRAERCGCTRLPSRIRLSRLSGAHPLLKTGAYLLLKTGADFPIGYKNRCWQSIAACFQMLCCPFGIVQESHDLGRQIL